ncbi:hypothetical protein [Parachitinimonas caeni]|uniref:Uncharacterized protein n=1 Tax=Parachitinimonas caeni TaxID=3031301 RepID=A0ABT7E3B7_9NEIS|nr:hypothetical protein [Parachitinimonas caeni]MDK2126812.1 hypothetical protein [Parachitinimonas caeni]
MIPPSLNLFLDTHPDDATLLHALGEVLQIRLESLDYPDSTAEAMLLRMPYKTEFKTGLWLALPAHKAMPCLQQLCQQLSERLHSRILAGQGIADHTETSDQWWLAEPNQGQARQVSVSESLAGIALNETVRHPDPGRCACQTCHAA